MEGLRQAADFFDSSRGRDTGQVIDTCTPATDELTQHRQTNSNVINDWLKLSH